MEKFSVKKPFTVFVAVIIVIVFGFVSVTDMPAELLPEMDLPYLMVITTYPGASPERVESEVSQPLENALGTVTHVKNVNSISSENFSMVQLEFENGTNMDSAMVKVSGQMDQVSSALPEACGTPNIMEISMDMLATMYIGVEHKGDDIYQLSDYVNDEILPVIQRQNGVASVTNIGLVEQSIQVELNANKINGLNDRILAMTSRELASALRELNTARSGLDTAQKQLEEQEKSFGSTLSSGLFGGIKGNVGTTAAGIREKITPLITALTNLQTQVRAMETGSSSTANSSGGAKNILSSLLPGRASSPETENAGSGDTSDAPATPDSGQADTPAVSGGDDAENTDGDTSGQEEADGSGAEDAEPPTDTPVSSETPDNSNLTPSGSGISDENAALLRDVSSQLEEIISGLKDAREKLESADTYTELMRQVSRVSAFITQLRTVRDELNKARMAGKFSGAFGNAAKQAEALTAMLDKAPELMDTLEGAFGALTQAQLDAAVGFSTAATQLAGAQTQLDDALSQYQDARESALKNANLDALMDASTLSQLIYAQNFSMPAGYIDDKDDQSWLLKVGDEFEDADAISSSLLCRIDGVGTVLLDDVADITLIDNSENSYASLNGEEAVVLSIYKGSSSGTNEVSRNVKKAIEELSESDENLEIVTLMDQGEYIDLIVTDILKSMLMGAFLAILVLAVFLKSVRPTLIVALSIPLSVLFALTLMYFTGLTLNMMTLSGLSLGIGMLVDNSIVVLENIFRLRGRGYTAPHAAVQGARQVGGAIFASTLTTICVFVPMVFSEGTVRQLMLPLAFSVGYCLFASLVTAMTVVPAASSTVMKNLEPKVNTTFEKIQNRYGHSLRWCLSHKVITLSLAIALLALSIVRIVTMGIVILPEIEGEELNLTITTPEEDDRATSYQKVDDVLDNILKIDGITYVGILDAGSSAGMFTSLAAGSDEYGEYIGYVKPEDGAWNGKMKELCEEVDKAVDGIDCEVVASTGSMGDMSAMMSTGLSLNIYGDDLNQLEKIGKDVSKIVDDVEGFTEVSDGSEDADPTLHLIINKDKAMSKGLTVAQIYAAISQRLNTSVSSTTITTDGVQYEVIIKDMTHELTRENLLDLELDTGAAGMGAASAGGMGGMSAAGMGGGASAMAGSGSAASSMTGAGGASGDSEETTYKLGDFATLEETTAMGSVQHENLTRFITVSAQTEEGYNTTLLSRQLENDLKDYELPEGYSMDLGGETSQVNDMVKQMVKVILLALLLIYLIMVAQFQSLLSPFIIMFTIPLAFTGGMLGLILFGEQLSMLSMMGFLILIGTVVNNGIVFVDYANRLRMGGLSREDALVATGRTRMRPIIMTALTTILAMVMLIFGSGMGSQMGRGMAIVIAGGLLYATLMTLYIVPVMYDILFKRNPLQVDVGDDIDEAPDDAEDFLRLMAAEQETSGKEDLTVPENAKPEPEESADSAVENPGSSGGESGTVEK